MNDSGYEDEGEDDADFDAEDMEKDVDMAVDDLLQDENTRTTVNAVSEQMSAIRRSTLIGVNSSTMRNSSGELSPEEPAVKLHTFTHRDLEGTGSSDPEGDQVR